MICLYLPPPLTLPRGVLFTLPSLTLIDGASAHLSNASSLGLPPFASSAMALRIRSPEPRLGGCRTQVLGDFEPPSTYRIMFFLHDVESKYEGKWRGFEESNI